MLVQTSLLEDLSLGAKVCCPDWKVFYFDFLFVFDSLHRKPLKLYEHVEYRTD